MQEIDAPSLVLKETYSRVPGSVRLIAAPLDYAKAAFLEISRQLKTVKSPKRKRKLEAKLLEWHKFMQVFLAETK